MNALRRIVLLLVCLATLEVTLVPGYLIQPFSAQTDAGLVHPPESLRMEFQPVVDVRLIDARAEKDVAADALVIGVTTGEEALAFPVSRLGCHQGTKDEGRGTRDGRQEGWRLEGGGSTRGLRLEARG